MGSSASKRQKQEPHYVGYSSLELYSKSMHASSKKFMISSMAPPSLETSSLLGNHQNYHHHGSGFNIERMYVYDRDSMFQRNGSMFNLMYHYFQLSCFSYFPFENNNNRCVTGLIGSGKTFLINKIMEYLTMPNFSDVKQHLQQEKKKLEFIEIDKDIIRKTRSIGGAQIKGLVYVIHRKEYLTLHHSLNELLQVVQHNGRLL